MAGPRGSRRHGRVREATAPRYAAEPDDGVAGVLYDSDVIIEILRGRSSLVDAARRLESSGVPTYCSAVSVAEIHAALRAGEEVVTEAFFGARGEIILDGQVGRVAGSYLARYAGSHGLELGDALIAAAATSAGVRLWTRNRKHYPMPDLRFHEP
jgi:predicted nucleic acid-binding protein